MNTRRFALPLTLIALVGVLAGCAPSIAKPAATQEPAPVVSPAAPSNEDLADYFSAVAGVDPVALLDVADRLAAPGSNAYAYAIEQGGAAQAFLDAGFPGQASDLETIDGGFSICGTDGLNGVKLCNDFNNLEYVDGKLSDFDAGGTPLAGRITLGSADLIPLGDLATVRLIAAYRTISGSVNVVLEVRSNVDGLDFGYGSSYQAPDGRQSNPAGVTGPTSLQAGALGNYLIAFDGAAFGGTLRVVTYDSSYNEVAAQIAIAAP